MSRPDIGTQVRVRLGAYEDSLWVNATVNVHLSTQFTAEGQEGQIVFGLYTGEGTSWKRGW